MDEEAKSNVRELTKSAFSFSWAMSMFGAQQMANFFRPTKAAQSFQQVTSATEAELDQALKQVFRMGDDVQRRMVDVLFGAFTQGGLGNGRTSQTAGRDASVTSPPPPQASQPAAQASSQVAQSSSLGWSAIPVPGSQEPQSAGAAQPVGSGDQAQAALPYEADISPDYPFQPHYVEVFGSKMHYIEQGSGEPIVFIHGNPTWSYLWRNVLPHLVPYGRCIAVDIIGYGRSDKPHIQYKWTDQRKYVEEFFRKMGLKHVVLVLHDWGVSLGLSYAMRHESNVRAIAFMEGIFRPFPQWKDFSTPE